MTPLAQALSASPELFPAALDPVSGAVTLWRLSREDYQRAGFLDGRIAAGKPARQIAFSELARAVDEAKLPENCHFIFHIGHVGSTLLSRLLGRHPALFSLREPDILRTLTACPPDLRLRQLPVFLKLWSRNFEPARAIVKTTSFVSEIAAELLSRPYNPRALAVGVSPEIYLATIFGGANAPSEARALAPSRLSRLKRRLAAEWRLEDLGKGEIVGMGWLCEALSIAEAVATANARVLVVNFEDFLNNAHRALGTAFAHLGVHQSEAEISDILDGPEMRAYSKAPEYQYNADTRRAVLADGRTRHAREIREGLLWLERVAAQNASVGRALLLFN
ncbi:MAG TPA: hypothetical protein VHT03_11040 [Rhizomicrobium sp.]|jgi:hypothetical protein|nr:hypothetical protein [Rhizomicrobium sp.]